VDVALEHLIRAERLRQDVAAYRRRPPTEAEREVALPAEAVDLDDETDWEAAYSEDEA